jgi:hypothetical protein
LIPYAPFPHQTAPIKKVRAKTTLIKNGVFRNNATTDLGRVVITIRSFPAGGVIRGYTFTMEKPKIEIIR